MLDKIHGKLLLVPELVRKYKVLKDKRLLDDGISAADLEKYLYASQCVGRHHGFIRSLKEGMCVDAHGDPIPWYTYPAIEQLSKWDFSGQEIFEYGCGNSTRWWAKRAGSVVSLENSAEWHHRILSSEILPPNVRPILAPIDSPPCPEAIEKYVHAIDAFGEFDVIVIDGFSRNKTRLACTRTALNHVRKGGMIILDNSDWHPEACRLLRDSGFLEIDFCGLGPLNTHAETTSLFLSRDFRILPLNSEHPGHCIGGLEHVLG